MKRSYVPKNRKEFSVAEELIDEGMGGQWEEGYEAGKISLSFPLMLYSLKILNLHFFLVLFLIENFSVRKAFSNRETERCIVV